MGLADLSPYAEGAFLTTGLADWAQTRQISRGYDPQTLYETNPIMGSHPSQSTVNAYMPLVGLAQYAGYRALPSEYKLPYALASALAEGSVVYNNKKNYNLDINPSALGLGALLTALEVYRHNNAKEKSNLDIQATYDKGPGFLINYRW